MKIKPYMGTEQRTYLEAVAKLEVVKARIKAELPPPPKRGEGNLEAYARAHERVNARHNLYEAIDAKLEARWALLDWAKGIVATEMAGEPELDDVLAAFDSAPKYPEMLEELVAMCLELNPSKPDTEMGER